MKISRWPGYRGTLADVFSGRANSFGLLRTILAVAVVVSHMYPLGWGTLEPLAHLSRNQSDLGKIAVVGFFVISGFMITGSGLRTTIGRYAWHRALRILPGFWVSLAVSALVIAPLLYRWQYGSADAFWTAGGGPRHYLEGAWNLSMSNGYDVAGLTSGAVNAGLLHHTGLNGVLWSLPYEIMCYIVIGLLAAGGALRNARRTVPLMALALWILMLRDWITAPLWTGGGPVDTKLWVRLPLLGDQLQGFLVYLGFTFLLGATFRLYRDRLPVSDSLAALCAVVAGVSLHWGGFFVLGYPAIAYLLLWLAVRLPRAFHRVGSKRDFSYGIYVYGFTVEQALTMLGYAKHGHAVYLALALAGTVVLAALSWYVVESPMMRLKDWTPWPVRRLKAVAARGSEPVVIPHQQERPPLRV
ncbi:acyltransferase family protein [Kitasatospora sp. NPDC052868]|uniref:acyltransferase family protein n=1 Tax=Kitasatospora sp. NPDC052868 TaxID=3364060 RepID=UPI0037CAB0FF